MLYALDREWYDYKNLQCTYVIIGNHDYGSGPFNITVSAGEVSASYNLSIIDNNIFEASESFALTINSSSLPSRISIQSGCVLMITIVDDDSKLCF